MSVVLSEMLLPFAGYCRVLTGFARDGALRQWLDSQPVSCVLVCFSDCDPFPVRITIMINLF